MPCIHFDRSMSVAVLFELSANTPGRSLRAVGSGCAIGMGPRESLCSFPIRPPMGAESNLDSEARGEYATRPLETPASYFSWYGGRVVPIWVAFERGATLRQPLWDSWSCEKCPATIRTGASLTQRRLPKRPSPTAY